MFLEDYYPLSAHYVNGAKKITFRSFHPKIVEGNLQLQYEKAKGNFDLYFNQDGLLSQSEHFDDQLKAGKTNYFYDKKKRLVKTEVFTKKENILFLQSAFTYTAKGRIITERYYVYHFDEITGVSEIKHTYSGNVEIVIESTNPEDDYTNVILITYDEKQRPIEKKSINSYKRRCYWLKKVYDEKNNLQEEYFLDETGQTTSIIEYKPNNEKGASPSYIRTSQNKDFTKDNIFTYNEKGQWISQLVLLNNDPFSFYERTIEYFHLTLFD